VQILKQTGILAIVAVFAAVLFSAAAFATDISSCPYTISSPGTYVLTQNISSSGTCITIDVGNIELDCQGFTIDGDDSGYGIDNIRGWSGGYSNVVIRNCVITDFDNGIFFYSEWHGNADYGNIINNTFNSNNNGINVYTSYSNLINNTFNSNNRGIYLYQSSNNNLTNNIANLNGDTGIHLEYGSNNILTNNIATNNNNGITISSSSNNTLTNNTANSNDNGIYLSWSSNNTFVDNTVCLNMNYDITLDSSSSENSGDNTCSALQDDDSNTVTCSNSCTYPAFVQGQCEQFIVENTTLTENIENCANYGIIIAADNVTLDCAGNSITGNLDDYGIFNNNGRDNVIVKNCNITNFNIGISFYRASNGTIVNNMANSNNVGIYLVFSSNNTLTNNTANSNGFDGIDIYGSYYNILTNNTANSNNYNGIWLSASYNNLTNNVANLNGDTGIYLSRSSNNTFINNNATGNILWDYYAYWSEWDESSLNNIVTNLTTQQNLVSFTSKDIALKGLTTADEPADPTNYKNIGKYINATNNSADSWLYINISYTDTDVAGINESSIGIWRYDGANWVDTGFANVRGVGAANNFAYANISTFSPFGLFGEEYTLAAPTDSFTSALAINGSINGNLSNGTSYSTNQNVTFLNATSGRKYFMASANFSGANVDFSSLKVDASNGKIAVNKTGVTGLYGTHTLWLPKTADNGVYVCPNAVAVSEVSTGCSGVIVFAGAGTQSGITVSVDGSYWKIAGLTGSGVGEGEGGGAVPEFSTITLLLALGIVAGGLVLIRRREF